MATTKVVRIPPAPESSALSSKAENISYPRWFGGSASCVAVIVSHPFDLIKVRMQTVSNGTKQSTIITGMRILQGEGAKGFYHVTYGTSRIALYEEMKQSAKKSNQPLSTPILGIMAASSGFIGAIFGTPADIANVRMQNDASLPQQQRRNYRNVLDAWVQMKRTEGWRSFRQGLWPNCFRSGIMTASQLASYDSFKRLIHKLCDTDEERPLIHFAASLLASLVATSISSPMDVIRTQLMSSSNKTSVFEVVRNLMHVEGPRWVFRGWTPSFVRLGPQTIATLVLLEQHKKIYRMLNS
ncbi:hypothetical protein N7481_002347 [Penicillium waksmanii]|uniref:uncharacterized protein n=1 Tax=Penicillium waksmanii TaxID=69791 RepID=UPI0025490CCA|nr:uncharacterized protein N7481_002347 [Penicillium waksmanii]KAJ5995370.1 hypothetical protein N7481_002347 [Penicillium waksmanii]